MTSSNPRCTVVGRGRLGAVLRDALAAAGLPVTGPLGGRGATGAGADVVLLCVPDTEISAAAACLTGTPLVGHCSGATTLAPLAPHEAFSLHPLMTFTASATPAAFVNVPAAVAGSTAHARETAQLMATALGMVPFTVADEDRAAYHASASIASNFLVTLEWAAEQVGGLDRRQLAPLVRATVDNWAAEGPHAALTGPIARGDDATVARQRAAVAERRPSLVALFDSLTATTRALVTDTTTQAAT